MPDEKPLSSCVRRAEPTIVYTPLTTREEREKAEGKKAPSDAFHRAENEDDDGYDPYSDRVEKTPFFESDPWS